MAALDTHKEARILKREAKHESHLMKLRKKRVMPDGGSEDPISFTHDYTRT